MRLLSSWKVLALLAGVFSASAVGAEQVDGRYDIDCAVVGQAYRATRATYHYRETVYELDSNGGRRQYAEIIYGPVDAFQKIEATGRWEAFSLLGRHGEVNLTSCTFVEVSEGKLRYFATWHSNDRKYIASADVWLTAKKPRRLETAIRSYPKDSQQFPFSVSLSVFDYEPDNARVPELSE